MLIKDYMSRVSRHRSGIMGFCILAVVLCHADFKFQSGPLSYFFNLLWEIDIFFFLTGMGVYRSLCRDERLLPFYRRRFTRIYPRYLPIIIIYFIPIFALYTDASTLPLRLRELLGNVSLLGWLNNMDNQFNWYIQAVMVFYFVSPPLVLLVRRFGGDWRKLAALLGFFVITQPCFMGSGTLIAYSRAIAFVMGMVGAELAAGEKNFRINVPVLLLVFAAGNLLAYYTNTLPVETGIYYGICWYPGLLVVPGMMLILCVVFEFCSKYPALRWISRFFELMGEYSLDIYLVNVLVYDVIARLRIEINGNLMWALVAAAIIPLSLLYGAAMNRLLSRGKPKTA